jgi:hypothetical protein
MTEKIVVHELASVEDKAIAISLAEKITSTSRP